MAKIDFDKFVCKVMDILYHESYYQAESSFYNLFNKSLKDQGLRYNPEPKEIESIEQPSEHKLVEAVDQKPEWSEEDERMLESVIWHLRYSVNNGDVDHSADELEEWLKSLKERIK